MTDLLLYTSIRDYIYARIEFLTEHILSENLALALTIVVGLLTLWITIQGYMIVTGRSQEGLKGFVYGLGKNYIVLLVALGVASSSSFAIRTLTDDLSDGISQIMTGKSDSGSACLTKSTNSFIGCKIDMNLTATQTMMGIMNGIDTAGDPSLEDKVDQMRWFAGVGTAGPGIVAGTMLIVYRIAMSLFIGFAPIFILSLMFKKTAPLFQKWLYHGLATIFSSVLLAVMADMSMDLVSNVSVALFTSNEAMELLTGDSASGVMYSITQQLGLGLMLSTLLIVVPPMAGMWFNGLMSSSYYGNNYFSGWNSMTGGTPGSGAGSGAHQQIEHRANQVTERLAQGYNQPTTAPTPNSLTNKGYMGSPSNIDPNQIKTPLQTQYGQAAGSPKLPLPTPKPDPKQQPDDSI